MSQPRIGLIYVLNPTMGIFEFIPDNLPLIGNLDEGVAFLLIWFGLVEYLEGKKGSPGQSRYTGRDPIVTSTPDPARWPIHWYFAW